jgi:hypothetical protein
MIQRREPNNANRLGGAKLPLRRAGRFPFAYGSAGPRDCGPPQHGVSGRRV